MNQKIKIIVSTLLIASICLIFLYKDETSQFFQKQESLQLGESRNKNNFNNHNQSYQNEQYKTLNIQTQCKHIHLKQFDGVVRSGFLNVGIKNSSSALGFIFYGREGTKQKDIYKKPTIIWLNGGPGCTSQFGNFFEIGPLHLNMKSNLTNHPKFLSEMLSDNNVIFNFTTNNHAWTKEYNVLFVDQPISTGISYAEKEEDIPVNQSQIAEQFYFALNELYNTEDGCFYQLGMNKKGKTPPPLFIFGESYAGKYIPSIAQKIIQEGNKYNLKSIGLGDAFVAPALTLQTIPDYALKNNLINSTQYEQSILAAQDVLDAMNDPLKEADSRSLFWRFLHITNPLDVDVYNIKRSKGELNDGITLETFLNNEQHGIRDVFNLSMLPNDEKIYTRCDKSVQKAMANDFMRNDCISKVEYLLNQGLDVTIFNGDLDMLVPYTAPPQWIKSLTRWANIEEFNNAETFNWYLQKQIVGNFKSYKNLSLYIIYNSGHMVPEDQPEVALKLINQTVKKALSKNNSSNHN